jgi:hypothetical protein
MPVHVGPQYEPITLCCDCCVLPSFVIPQPPANAAEIAGFVASNNPEHAQGGCEPGREDVERELWSSVCMSEFFTALKGVQVALQLASTQGALDGAVASLGAVASTKVDLEGVDLVCDRLPGVLDRRWGPGAASALADEADRLYTERRRVSYVPVK